MPAASAARADAREVDVCRDVLGARLASHGGWPPCLGPAIVWRANVVSVPAAWVAEYRSRASWP